MKFVLVIKCICISLCILVLYIIGLLSLLVGYALHFIFYYLESRESLICYDNCYEKPVLPPFGVLGRYCGSPFLQINCTNTTHNGLGYWSPNSVPTNVLVTNTTFHDSTWNSGAFLVVPHPSMSTCAHLKKANFSSLFHNLRSFQQFNFQMNPMSSILVFNCSNLQAVREDEYPLGFARGGDPCTRFRSCLLSTGSLSNSMDCFQINRIHNTNQMEDLIASLGCTSFTASYNEKWEDSDYEILPNVNHMDYVVRVGWTRLPNDQLCDSELVTRDVCGFTENGSLVTLCHLGQNVTEWNSCPGPYSWKFGLLVGCYTIGVIFIVVCVVKRQSLMLCLTGERYFKVEGFSEPPKKMSYRLLNWATQSFRNKIGEGSFGKVYSALLPRQNTPLAVKVLDNARHSHRQFIAEVESIGNVHHFNLVRLIGFCSHKAKRLLVFEFIPNGSLDKHLFSNQNESSPNELSWARRYSIILGIGRGLAYLHHECMQQVVHLDIKPGNILLDHEFNAKIADFGLSKLMGIDESRASTTVRGTPGYMAPELLKDSIVSTKCDVYSFGVLILEVIAGRKWLEIDASNSQLCLPNWAFEKAHEQDILPLVDERVACPEIMEQARILVLLSMWCIQQDPCLRPTMIKAVEFIEGKDFVPSNPPNPFGSTLNIEDPIQALVIANSSGTSMQKDKATTFEKG